MISGSVAVEGQGRGLGQVLGQPTPVPEFLRPLPRAAPYGRYHPHAHIPHASHHLQQQQQQQHQSQQSHLPRHREDEDSHSTSLPYPGVTFLHHPYLPYYGSYHSPTPVPLPQPPPVAPIPTPAAVAPASAPAPAPPALAPQSPPSAPRGKEGSLKHRLLSRERPPPMGHFTRGALIQLGSGQLRRVEDMRTEDFVMSADSNPDMKLVQSTVVKIVRLPSDKVTLTLSYNGNRSQADLETAVERPFFVYGQGWASCSPERTLQCLGLQVSLLQVGDICVSLIRRETPLPTTPLSHQPSPFGSLPPPLPHPFHQPASATIVTTATTTAMTARPADDPQSHPENLSIREDSRKRRWSAPDVCNEDGTKKSRTIRH